MNSSSVSGFSPVIFTSSSAPARPSKAAAEQSSSVPSDGFSSSSSSSEATGLIPSNLLGVSPSSTSVRATSPQLLEAQALGEQVAANAVPGLGALSPAKAGGEKAEILSLFDGWNSALLTGNPDKVVEKYAPDAILLPTVSNKVRHNHGEIKDYFDHFLAKGPKGKIDESNVRLFGDVAINSGVYTFDFANGTSVQARYTFVYRKLEGEWKIAEHHSSAMPEKTPHQYRQIQDLAPPASN